jgi:hypothetical protein
MHFGKSFQYVELLQKKIHRTPYSIYHISRIRIAVNARMWFGIFMPKISPNGLGIESQKRKIDA